MRDKYTELDMGVLDDDEYHEISEELNDVEEWVEIASKYDGYCKDCGHPISEGERIYWAKGYGAICSECKAVREYEGK